MASRRAMRMRSPTCGPRRPRAAASAEPSALTVDDAARAGSREFPFTLDLRRGAASR